jgi:hypothetical protein
MNGLAAFLGDADIGNLIAGLADTIVSAFEVLLRFVALIPGQMGEAASKAILKIETDKMKKEIEEKYDRQFQEYADKKTREALYGTARPNAAPAAAANAEKTGQAIGQGMEKGTKEALGIQSPSKVFADIGKMSALGLTEGVSSSNPQLEAIFARLITAPMYGGARGRSETAAPIEVTVNVEVNGAGGDGQALGDEVAVRVRQELLDVLERLNLERGSTPQ